MWGMFLGFMICFPVAFVVLVFATGSILVSLYAILSIVGIVGSLLGFTKVALGWTLGTSESIAGTICIGLAVDYTVHLGHVYTESKEKTREGKMTRDDAKKLFDSMDTDGSGTISRKELAAKLKADDDLEKEPLIRMCAARPQSPTLPKRNHPAPLTRARARAGPESSVSSVAKRTAIRTLPIRLMGIRR